MAEKIVLCPAAKKTKKGLQKRVVSALRKADKIKSGERKNSTKTTETLYPNISVNAPINDEPLKDFLSPPSLEIDHIKSMTQKKEEKQWGRRSKPERDQEKKGETGRKGVENEKKQRNDTELVLQNSATLSFSNWGLRSIKPSAKRARAATHPEQEPVQIHLGPMSFLFFCARRIENEGCVFWSSGWKKVRRKLQGAQKLHQTFIQSHTWDSYKGREIGE